MVRSEHSTGTGAHPRLQPALIDREFWADEDVRQLTWLGWVVGLILTIVLAGALGTGIAVLRDRNSDGVDARFAARPLPYEWQWELEGVAYEHMYPESKAGDEPGSSDPRIAGRIGH